MTLRESKYLRSLGETNYLMANREAKRRKFSKWNHNTKLKSVEPGLSGLYFTCHGDERRGVVEAYQLIDLLCGFDEAKSDEKEVDDDEALEKQCAGLREKEGKNERRKQRPTGVKNNLFISIPGGDPVSIASNMVDLCRKEARCRFLDRVLPVERTELAELPKLNQMISELIAKYMISKDGVYPTYALDFKARNHNSITRQNALEMLNDVVTAICPSAKVNLSDPEITFFIHIAKTTIFAGVAHGYQRKGRYALRPVNSDAKDEEIATKKRKLDSDL